MTEFSAKCATRPQPSDEQIKQALYKELDCEGGWPLYEVTTGNVISVVRALLANTAQGKP